MYINHNNRPHNNETAKFGNTLRLAMTVSIALLLMMLSTSNYAGDNIGSPKIFDQTEAEFSDEDALGAYGDENDEEVLDEVTVMVDTDIESANKSFTENVTMAVTQDEEESSGYGEANDEDEDA